MLLDDKEKERFAAYCEQVVSSANGILQQFDKIPGHAIEEMKRREKQRIAAFMIVAADLRSGETITVK